MADRHSRDYSKDVDENLLELVIIGAGPTGISLAAEGILAGVAREKILVLEKEEAHSWAIRKYYPDEKLVTANYKGHDVICHGVLCMRDMSKDEALSYLDQAIEDYKIPVRYREEVQSITKKANGFYLVKTSQDAYLTKTCALAIGVMGKPNRPNYHIPAELKSRVHFEMSSKDLLAPSGEGEVLVVGGGDSAGEYAQYLVERGWKVDLAYRRDTFFRMNDINRKSLEDLERQGKLHSLMKTDIDSLEVDEKGHSLVSFQGPERQRQKSYEHIVYALGGSKPKDFLKAVGINVQSEGPVVDESFEAQELPGIFLVGDISAGKKGGSLNVAFNSANRAMKEFCSSYLDCR